MSSISIGCIGILLLLAAIFLRMPIGMAMLAVGTAGFAAISGTDAALGLLRGVPYETFANPTYAVVCLFLLMGNFAFKSGISDELFACVNTWLGRLREDWPCIPWRPAAGSPPSAAPPWPAP